MAPFKSPELADVARRLRRTRSPLELLRLGRERASLSAGEDPHTACSRPRIAVVGGYTPHPFLEFFEQQLFAHGACAELDEAPFDSDLASLRDPQSPLHADPPSWVIVLPSHERCRFGGSPLDPPAAVSAQAAAAAADVLGACAAFHQITPAEILVCNVRPPGDFYPGNARSGTLATPYGFVRAFNTALGRAAPPYVQICDLEFLAYRLGHERANDARGWFQSRQIGSPELQILLAGECARLVQAARAPAKKVLALDLDNTLWGGVLAELGPEGIELGDTTPRGEAFKAFQRQILGLAARGVLLAVVSKNDEGAARAVFRSHPEMVLREEHVAAWRVNQRSKADNLRQIADDLDLGLDAFVFVDDDPAEIAIVDRFAPEVETLRLPADPSAFVELLDELRAFEFRSITAEDLARTERYRGEAERRASTATITDMDEHLRSLEMRIAMRPFCVEDRPRIAQLINKSNQWNLTTRRRTEAEVDALIGAATHRTLAVRLSDRFGNHGLISVVVLRLDDGMAEVDTWLMSCRVLNRRVEDEVLNEIARLTLASGRTTILARYIPTAKNGLVRGVLTGLGFSELGREGDTVIHTLDAAAYGPRRTRIASEG